MPRRSTQTEQFKLANAGSRSAVEAEELIFWKMCKSMLMTEVFSLFLSILLTYMLGLDAVYSDIMV